VRGAYHPHELSAHAARNGTGTHSLSISPDAAPPVWAEKRETDTAYDGCVAALIAAVAADAVGAPSGRAPSIGVLFGTHNAASAELILEHIRRAGLARVDETGKTPVFVLDPAVTARVAMGQLYGESQVGLPRYC
jgi:proline dehydrogenase